ncbi:MAG TPA: hypothetical protein VIT23_01110 [Terrimicrobiaceae bacterium]
MAEGLDADIKIRISLELKRRLALQAKREGGSAKLSDVVRKAIEEYLARNEPPASVDNQ